MSCCRSFFAVTYFAQEHWPDSKMTTVVCVGRGSEDISDAVRSIDSNKVQLIFVKFPIGSGTFKRNKFIYILYVGPSCGIVKRGQYSNLLKMFASSHLHGIPGMTVTEKENINFENIVRRMKDIFLADFGSFSFEQIREEYRARLIDEKKNMHIDHKRAAQRRPKRTLNGLHLATARSRSASPNTTDDRPRSNVSSLSMEPAMHSASLSNSPSSRQTASNRKAHPLCVSDETTERVLKSLREDNGAVNWAIFEPDLHERCLRLYGHGGIHEMVKNFPDEKWLFGLIRVSSHVDDCTQRRIIFFQWIGSQVRMMRDNTTAKIYPSMVRLLSPFAYEIFLVGQGDLHPQSIINKTKNAFVTSGSKMGSRSSMNGEKLEKDNLLSRVVLHDERGRRLSSTSNNSLEGEGSFDVFKVKPSSHSRQLNSRSLDSSYLSLTNSFEQAEKFDVDETIEYVRQDEGGLIWAIFEPST